MLLVLNNWALVINGIQYSCCTLAVSEQSHSDEKESQIAIFDHFAINYFIYLLLLGSLTVLEEKCSSSNKQDKGSLLPRSSKQ